MEAKLSQLLERWAHGEPDFDSCLKGVHRSAASPRQLAGRQIFQIAPLVFRAWPAHGPRMVSTCVTGWAGGLVGGLLS